MEYRFQAEDQRTEHEIVTCKLCGNPMREQETSFCACDASPPVRFENVPAHVCVACGEKVFSGEVVDRIQHLTRLEDADFRTIGLHVYDFINADRVALIPDRYLVTDTVEAWNWTDAVGGTTEDVVDTQAMETPPVPAL